MPNVDEKEQLDNKKDDLELSDDDLDAVAGGAFVEPTIVRKPVSTGFVGLDRDTGDSMPSVGFEVPLLRGK